MKTINVKFRNGPMEGKRLRLMSAPHGAAKLLSYSYTHGDWVYRPTQKREMDIANGEIWELWDGDFYSMWAGVKAPWSKVWMGTAHPLDLMEEIKVRTMYVNAYVDGIGYASATRAEADRAAGHNRTACAKVTFVNGQFDE